ncbi:MAG: 3-oxoacyl-[acyl-carrier-protein] reductase [Spirochaetaceae bacterium]|jgi:3-oxoacyl-[acyl-carrier protein] reductase|nr:3-oxoacyl-[acyl-carrier-protein] reductase [Spirochaetaceae bacterium]
MLSGKKALITGASRGIGRAIAQRFIDEGAEVWGLGTKPPLDLDDMAAGTSGSFHWQNADLSALESCEGVIETILKESGGLDILVNNAGITADNLSFRMTLADFQKVINLNLSAAFLVARTVARDMARKRRGSIINMASVVGMHGNGGQANYAASKAGLIAVTKSLAAEVAGRGVRVNAIAPGFIETDMTAKMTDEAKNKVSGAIPLGRLGSAKDVAALANFLASDDSAYITGQVIPIDGGLFM